jgi:C4-dicarboxylate transporter DctM subunit
MIVGYALLALVLMVLSVPLFFVFGISSAAIALEALRLPPTSLMQIAFGAMTKQVLVAIPVFIFAGNVMLHGGSAKRLVDFGLMMVGHLPGGMGVAMIISMGFFSAISGSILASIVAVGTVMMPTMVKMGYPKPFVVVLAAAAALIDALIPPSNTAIIYSALTHVPVSRTFAAGVFPGLVLMALLILYVIWRCHLLPRPPRASWPERRAAFVAAIPALLMPVAILGGLYRGFLTPAESASVAAVYAMVLGAFVDRGLTRRGVATALRDTAETTTIIFVIIAMATFFSVVITYTRAPQAIIAFFIHYNVGPTTFMLLAGLTLLILGTFLEVVPIFFLTMPIFFPLCQALKVDLLQFYVFMTGLVGIGMLTPPVCVGVYTASAVLREPPDRAFRSVPGFVGVGLVYAAIILAFPSLASWLGGFF